jgi:hypothetical protein
MLISARGYLTLDHEHPGLVLQVYKFDEHDRNLPHLRLQFARFTGPRGQSGPGGGGGGRVRR